MKKGFFYICSTEHGIEILGYLDRIQNTNNTVHLDAEHNFRTNGSNIDEYISAQL